MDDLISREFMKSLGATCIAARREGDGELIALGGIDMLPSAQPMRTKGKWTIEDCHAATYKYCCSNCGAHHRARYGFCPSCGAEMEGE